MEISEDGLEAVKEEFNTSNKSKLVQSLTDFLIQLEDYTPTV
jgi:hypothetical protein